MKKYIIILLIMNTFCLFSQKDADLFKIALSEIKKENYQNADSILTNLIEKDSLKNKKDFNKFYNRGIARERLLNFDSAISDYSIAILIKTELDYLYFDRCRCYFIMEKYNLAKKDIDVALKKNPKKSIYYSVSCIINLQLEKYIEVKEDCRRWIYIDDKAPKLYFYLSIANACLGDSVQSKAAISLLKIIDKKSLLIFEAEMFFDYKFRKNEKFCDYKNEIFKINPEYVFSIPDDEFIKQVFNFKCD